MTSDKDQKERIKKLEAEGDNAYYLLKKIRNGQEFAINATPRFDNKSGTIEAYTIDQALEKCVSCYLYVMDEHPKDLNLKYKLADVYCMYWANSGDKTWLDKASNLCALNGGYRPLDRLYWQILPTVAKLGEEQRIKNLKEEEQLREQSIAARNKQDYEDYLRERERERQKWAEERNIKIYERNIKINNTINSIKGIFGIKSQKPQQEIEKPKKIPIETFNRITDSQLTEIQRINSENWERENKRKLK